MQLSAILFALSGLAFASAMPNPNPIPLATRDIKDSLYVTFWENGCYDTKPGTQSTFSVNSRDGPGKPEECFNNGHYNWQSVQIRQPSNTKVKYVVDVFSGEGCNNPVGVSLGLDIL